MVKKSKKINKETFKLNYNYIIVTHYDIGKTNISVPRDISLWNSSKTPILSISKGGLYFLKILSPLSFLKEQNVPRIFIINTYSQNLLLTTVNICVNMYIARKNCIK